MARDNENNQPIVTELLAYQCEGHATFRSKPGRLSFRGVKIDMYACESAKVAAGSPHFGRLEKTNRHVREREENQQSLRAGQPTGPRLHRNSFANMPRTLTREKSFRANSDSRTALFCAIRAKHSLGYFPSNVGPPAQVKLQTHDLRAPGLALAASSAASPVPRQADIARYWKTSLGERIDHALPTARKSNDGVTLAMRRASEIAAILRI
jgi:hypothetical protein